MPEIKRIEPRRRFSEAVVCDGVVYISGQVDLARNRDPKYRRQKCSKQSMICLQKPDPIRSIFFAALSTFRTWVTFPK